MNINNKKELQNIALNHSADIDYTKELECLNEIECTKELYSFFDN